MSTQTKIISSDGTAPKLNGTQLFFRTQTEYIIDNNGKVIDSRIRVYYTPYANGLVPGTGTSSGWNPNAPGGLQQGGYTLAAYSADKGKTFTPFRYDQSDADAGRIPFGKNVGDRVLSPQAIASLNSSNGVLNQAINNSVINTAVNTQQGLAGQLSAKLQNTGGGTGGTGGTGDRAKPVSIDIDAETKQEAGSYNPSGAQYWVYPTGLAKNQQDYIRFEMLEYGGLKKVGERTFDTILGRVYLPIQPSISDINTVDWQNDTINPLQAFGATGSLSVIKGSGFGKAFDDVFGGTNMKDVGNAAALWAAGKAVGTNIFSRFAGAAVNPNLELLFNGPQLRPFNFSFKLSPRDEDEAKQVKGIIRFFKKGMSVRKASSKLFLKAPNVFKITYIDGRTGKPHTSINSIKVCALSQCSVDYTPDGSYATFYDKAATMTQYGLTLQFNELEPIFNDNYDEDVPGQSTIGY